MFPLVAAQKVFVTTEQIPEFSIKILGLFAFDQFDIWNPVYVWVWLKDVIVVSEAGEMTDNGKLYF